MPGFTICGTGDGPSSLDEAIRDHRWVIDLITDANGSLGGPVTNDLHSIRFRAKKVSRPSHEFQTMVMHRGMEEIKLPGKIQYGNCDFTFYDVVTEKGSVSSIMHKWWANATMDINQSRLINPKFKKRIRFSLLDNCKEPVHQYSLGGCWPVKVNSSDLDYSNSSISETTVIVSFDKLVEGLV